MNYDLWIKTYEKISQGRTVSFNSPSLFVVFCFDSNSNLGSSTHSFLVAFQKLFELATHRTGTLNQKTPNKKRWNQMLFQTEGEYLYTGICCWCYCTLLEQKWRCCCFHLGRSFSNAFAVNSQLFSSISSWSFVDRFRGKDDIL